MASPPIGPGWVGDQAASFLASLPPRGSLLALDVSRRRVGAAGTDALRRLVTPLATWPRRGWAQDLGRLQRLVAEREVAGLVVGWPLNMDGSVGPMAQAARDTARRLAIELGLPALLQDERLTSFAVEAAVEEGRVRRPVRGAPLDHLAAAVILEDALRRLGASVGDREQ
jgi:putative Holliday junction resolvase